MNCKKCGKSHFTNGACAACGEKRTLQQIEARLLEIRQALEAGDNITPEEMTALETEVAALTEERTAILGAAETRTRMLADIAAGNIGGSPVSRMSAASGNSGQAGSGAEPTDRFDTPEYRRHFMEFVCRGTQLPDEYRAAAVTTTGDAGAVIPTTIMNEIIREAKTFGNIFNKVRRLNVQGGVSFPILTLIPTAKWIGETTPSDRQKIDANESVTFNYYGLECRISRTLLVSVVAIDEFQRLFVPLAAEAMVKAIEISIIRGTGSGQMRGVINEPRIPAANTITLTAAEFSSWADWKKKVFAKMKKSYRNGEFVMAQGTFDGQIDGMVDANGQPIGRINYGIDGGETYRFGGRNIEIVEDEILPAYEDAAIGDVVAIFMRFRDYAINTNMQMTIVHWVDHDNNERVNKAIIILDGKVIDPHGILIIKKGA